MATSLPNLVTNSSVSGDGRSFDALRHLLEQIGNHTHDFHRSDVQRAWEQAAAGEAIALDRPWQSVLVDVCRGLGLRPREVACTPRQFADLAADGIRLVAGLGDDGWLAVADGERGRLQVFNTRGAGDGERLSRRQLERLLAESFGTEPATVVAIPPERRLSASAGDEQLKPLPRLWRLLKPEGSDIWITCVFAMVIGILALATPIAVETLINTVAFGRFMQPVVVLSLLLLTFMAFAGALRALQTFVVEIIQRRLFARIAAEIAYRLPRVRHESLQGHSPRELVNRFFDVVVVQKVTAQLLLDGVSLAMGTLVGMTLLAFYHPWLLAFDLFLLIMIALVVTVVGRGAVKSSIKESKSKYRMAAWLEEVAECLTALRSEAGAGYAMARADQLAYEYLSARSAHFRILMRQIILALGMQAVASTVLLGLGGWLVISGELTLGQLVAAELVVAAIVGSFAKLGKHMESFYDLMAAVDKLGTLLDLPIEPADGTVATADAVAGEWVLQGVGYRTPDGVEVVPPVDLGLRAGDRLAVSGPSGSGKGLLLDLLYGLRAPTAGQIKVGGMETREFQKTGLRAHVALVRYFEVFEGTIVDNVQVGRPGITLADVRAALQNVGLLEELVRLPEQLDTRLISTGFPLTRSQLVRLMVARACVSRPRLLLIDGMLDSLPDHQASEVAEWLCRPEHPWKLVLVTGRADLARFCNRHFQMGAPQSPPVSDSGVSDRHET